MLTKLFSSPVRVKILKLLIMQPDRTLSATTIAKATGAVVRSVNKEITKLVEAGAVTEESRDTEVNGKKVKVKHYRGNPQFRVFDEVRQLFLRLEVMDADMLEQKIAKLGTINYVVLMGSFVGDTQTKIDLLIVGRAARARLEKFVHDLEKQVGREINWAHLELADYDYRRQIGDMFLMGILGGRKIEIYSKFV